MTENVVEFAPRAAVPSQLPLDAVELRLFRLGESCSVQMTLCDREYNIVDVLEFKLVSRPRHLILDLLCEAWERWRGGSQGLAS